MAGRRRLGASSVLFPIQTTSKGTESERERKGKRERKQKRDGEARRREPEEGELRRSGPVCIRSLCWVAARRKREKGTREQTAEREGRVGEKGKAVQRKKQGTGGGALLRRGVERREGKGGLDRWKERRPGRGRWGRPPALRGFTAVAGKLARLVAPPVPELRAPSAVPLDDGHGCDRSVRGEISPAAGGAEAASILILLLGWTTEFAGWG